MVYMTQKLCVIMDKSEIFNLASESLDSLYEVNNTLSDEMYEELTHLNHAIQKIEKIYTELRMEIQI